LTDCHDQLLIYQIQIYQSPSLPSRLQLKSSICKQLIADESRSGSSDCFEGCLDNGSNSDRMSSECGRSGDQSPHVKSLLRLENVESSSEAGTILLLQLELLVH
ncbi:non-specific serine,threonine protein kinase, partial [Sarracenia purpurea var. burkii]